MPAIAERVTRRRFVRLFVAALVGVLAATAAPTSTVVRGQAGSGGVVRVRVQTELEAFE